jgi:hypothetical protein
MTANEKIPWKRLSVEAAAIVGSILLAFAIDAWWAERLERITEREELSRLYDEFSSNRERLGPWVSVDGFMQRTKASSLRVSEIMDAAMKGGSETVSVLDVQIADLVRSATFEAETPVYESLVRSGRIEIVENREIVTAIAKWERSLRNAAEIEQTRRQFVNNQLLPVLAARSNIQHVLMNRFVPIQLEPLDPNRMTEIHVDPLLVNLVGERFHWEAVTLLSLTEVRGYADHVMSVISRSLEQ